MLVYVGEEREAYTIRESIDYSLIKQEVDFQFFCGHAFVVMLLWSCFCGHAFGHPLSHDTKRPHFAFTDIRRRFMR